MGDLSASVRLKLDRANEHAEAIRLLIAAWEDPKPYAFVTEVDEQSDGRFTRFRYLIRIYRPLPADALSKALGDCIHNFRCVLDHLVWELSVEHSGDPPPKPTGVSFPGNASGQRPPGLHAVHPHVVAEVKRLHIDHTGHDPACPPLWMLCQLSNMDKHRAIHAVFHWARSVDVKVVPSIRGTRIEVVDRPTLEGDAVVLARVAVPRPLLHRQEVYVNSRTEHGIAIAETARTPVAHLGMTVTGIKKAVEDAAERLRHLLP